jgi:hypothetical protein
VGHDRDLGFVRVVFIMLGLTLSGLSGLDHAWSDCYHVFTRKVLLLDLSRPLYLSPLKGSLILVGMQGPGTSLRSWFWDVGRSWSWLGLGHLTGLLRPGSVFPLSPFLIPRGRTRQV